MLCLLFIRRSKETTNPHSRVPFVLLLVLLPFWDSPSTLSSSAAAATSLITPSLTSGGSSAKVSWSTSLKFGSRAKYSDGAATVNALLAPVPFTLSAPLFDSQRVIPFFRRFCCCCFRTHSNLCLNWLSRRFPGSDNAPCVTSVA